MFVQRLGNHVSRSGLITLLHEGRDALDVHHVQVTHPDDFSMYHWLSQAGYDNGLLDYDPQFLPAVDGRQARDGSGNAAGGRITDAGIGDLAAQGEHRVNQEEQEAVQEKGSLEELMDRIYLFRPQDNYFESDEEWEDMIDIDDIELDEDFFPEDLFSLEYVVSPQSLPRAARERLVRLAPHSDFSVYRLSAPPDRDLRFLEDALEAYFADLDLHHVDLDEFARHDVLCRPATDHYLYSKFL